MAAGYAALLSLLLTALTLTSYHRYRGHDRATSSDAGGGVDRNLTVYAMAVGQGDGNIILCPNGRDVLIVDMGAKKASQYSNKTYGAFLLKKFKGVEKPVNIHVVITHPDEDHWNFLPMLLDDDQLRRRVQGIVIGGIDANLMDCVPYDKCTPFTDWINKIRQKVPVYTVNDGKECFNNSDCTWTPTDSIDGGVHRYLSETSGSTRNDPWQFCGKDVSITVLGANICPPSPRKHGYCVDRENKNAKSIILKLVYKEWSLFLSGDFEGKPQQKRLIRQWSHAPSMLRSTYYKMAHHGTWNSKEANSVKLLNAIRPKRAYVSHGHPITTFCLYGHPRCEMIDDLLDVGSIEKLNTSTKDSFIICAQNKTGNYEQRWGYAIYATCRGYDSKFDRQICHDIMITTNGHVDYTTYVDVPEIYRNHGAGEGIAIFSKNKKKKTCKERHDKEMLKHRLSRLPSFCLA